MARRSRFSQEVRERAVRMVFDHRGGYASEWEAMSSIAGDDLRLLIEQRFAESLEISLPHAQSRTAIVVVL